MAEVKEYEVGWMIEVSADTPEDAASQVDNDYLKPCENGSWVYIVVDKESGDRKLVTVVDGLGKPH
jgi:hypothetical protein